MWAVVRVVFKVGPASGRKSGNKAMPAVVTFASSVCFSDNAVREIAVAYTKSPLYVCVARITQRSEDEIAVSIGSTPPASESTLQR